MGDDWRHTVTIEDVGSGDLGKQYSSFVAGERRCPPEDVGGFPGFELFLDAMADPAHEDYAHLRQWYGSPFDPDDIDEPKTERAVADIATRRQDGKAAYAKRQKSS